MRNVFCIISMLIILAMLGAYAAGFWSPPWVQPADPLVDEQTGVDVIQQESSSSKAVVSSARSESMQPVTSRRSSAPAATGEAQVEVIAAPTSSVASTPASRAAVSAVSSTPASRPPVNVITLPAKSSSLSSVAAEGGLPPGTYRTTGD